MPATTSDDSHYPIRHLGFLGLPKTSQSHQKSKQNQ